MRVSPPASKRSPGRVDLRFGMVQTDLLPSAFVRVLSSDACRTDLEMPLGPLNAASATSLVGGIQAMNLAKTPIAASLEQVANDLAGVKGQRVFVLITEGEETCCGDPAENILQLQEAGSSPLTMRT